jgi:hydrophobic/amphiphilic exporter-1 (mainly G- bacteria), HAE1 family
MSKATQETLEKLDLVFLPREAERPLILHFDPALDPIMELSFSAEGQRYEGEQGLRRLRRIAELQIKRALEPIKGVAAVACPRRARGGVSRVDRQAEAGAHRAVDPERDRPAPAGEHQRGRRHAQGGPRRIHGPHPQRIREPRSDRGHDRPPFEGQDVRIRDLGRVERAHKEREIITRTDGFGERADGHLQGGGREHCGGGQGGQTMVGEVTDQPRDRPGPGPGRGAGGGPAWRNSYSTRKGRG